MDRFLWKIKFFGIISKLDDFLDVNWLRLRKRLIEWTAYGNNEFTKSLLRSMQLCGQTNGSIQINWIGCLTIY